MYDKSTFRSIQSQHLKEIKEFCISQWQNTAEGSYTSCRLATGPLVAFSWLDLWSFYAKLGAAHGCHPTKT